MALLTNEDRYLPEFEWNPNFWVYNIFRVYETIFWRRWGIRAEMATFTSRNKNKFTIYHKALSLEAAFGLVEMIIRGKIKKWQSIRVFIPQLAPAAGMPQLAGPFMFAIAYDANTFSGAHAGQDNSFSHTCTGSNRYLTLLTQVHRTPDYHLAGITYNSVSMTSRVTNTGSPDSRIWDLVAPASGSNTVYCTGTNSDTWHEEWAISFSGCAQTGQPDNTGNHASLGNSFTSASWSITTSADNCWCVTVMQMYNQSGVSATAGTYVGQNSSGAFGEAIFYAGPKTPAGTLTTSFTCTSGTTCTNDFSFMSFAPVSITTVVKTVTAKARILTAGVAKTATAKARVLQPGVTKTVTAKARMLTAGVAKTIRAKAYILGVNTKLLTAKARIFKPNISYTATAKARIKIADIAKTVTAKARVKIAGIVKTLTAKAHIHAPRRGFILMKNKDQTYKQSMSDNRIR